MRRGPDDLERDLRGRGRGGPPHRQRRFAGEELRLIILDLLESGPRHGYQLMLSIGEKSGNMYRPSPGVLYPLLTMMQDQELVQAIDNAGSARKSFALAPAGKAEIEARRDELPALEQRLSTMERTSRREEAGPVRRAMMNLRTATMQRLEREDASDATAFDIAAILDKAAQEIERL